MSLMRHGFAGTNSQLHGRLRCGLRAERPNIRAGFFLPLYGGILLMLSAAYVAVLSGDAFEQVGGEK